MKFFAVEIKRKSKFGKFFIQLFSSAKFEKVGGHDFNPVFPKRARGRGIIPTVFDIVKSVILAKHQVSFSLGEEDEKKKF